MIVKVKKMTMYKCGHESDTVFLEGKKLTMEKFKEWRDTVGYNGNKSLCLKCWLEGWKEVKIE